MPQWSGMIAWARGGGSTGGGAVAGEGAVVGLASAIVALADAKVMLHATVGHGVVPARQRVEADALRRVNERWELRRM